MATCTNIDMFGGLVEEFIKQYEEVSKDDSLSDIEAADAKATLEGLYAYRKAIKEGDKGYIKAEGLVRDQSAERQALLEDVFEKAIGSQFTFTYGQSSKPLKGVLVAAKPTRTGVTVEFTEDGEAKSYSFTTSSTGRSQDSDDGTHITLEGFRNVMDNYQLSLEANEELELIFGSKDSKLRLDNQYRKEGYLHGDINHMKDTLKQLHLLGGEKASEEELNTYLELFDRMSPEFFNALELYIKEDAKVSEGVSRASRIDIAISKSPKAAGNYQSEASVYMEEVIHSMTASALYAGGKGTSQKATRLKRNLSALVETARKQLRWENFLPEVSIDAAAEEKHAKWLYGYIFNGEYADYEFLAKALAVPEVSKALKHVMVREGSTKKRLMEKIYDLFDLVVDVLRGEVSIKQYRQTVHDALVNLAFDLGSINTRANRTIAEKAPLTAVVIDFINGIDDSTRVKMNQLKDKITKDWKNKPLKADMPSDMYGMVKWTIDLIGASMVNPIYTKTMGAIATAWGLKPDGTVREIIGGLFSSDYAQRAAEFLAMQAGYIDKIRNNQIDVVRKSVLTGFSDPKMVTRELEEAMTDVLADTDLAALFGRDSIAKELSISKTTYDNKTLRTLLTDEEALDRLIANTKRALKDLDNTHYNWHTNQSVGLGIYMATHKGTPEQNLNAYSIAKGIRSTHRKRADERVMKAIDELSTLVAVKNTSMNARTAVADLMSTEWGGVQQVADIVEGFKTNSKETVFKGNKINMIKGYTKELFDDSIVMEIAPAEDEAKMQEQGFTKRGNLAPRAGDIRKKPMALYVTDASFRPERLRAGVRLNQIKSKGTTITDMAYKDGEGFDTRTAREMARRDINNIESEALKRAKKMEEGSYDFKDTIFGVTAVLNESGKVVDYRYMMDKETKKGLLKQDTRISEVLARSFGSLTDKEASAEHNRKALEEFKADMEKNWSEGSKGKDGLTDYTVIGPEVSDPELRKLFYMLPKEFRSYANSREDKSLAVRTDLKNLYFGYSHLSIADFPGLKKITPQLLIRLIKIAENLWVDVVKVIKTNILMKMPTVLLSNLISNFLYGVMRGYDPVTLVSMCLESYRDISAYNKNLKRIQELENTRRNTKVALRKENLSVRRKAELGREGRRAEQEMEALKRRNREDYGHIGELVKLGLDQNVEDVTNDTEHNTNKVSSFFDEQLGKAPAFVRTGTDILFVTRRTTYYKVANEFLETTDLMFRDVQNRIEKKTEVLQADGSKALPDWWLERQTDGYSPKQRLTGEERQLFFREAEKHRHYELVEDYVNYAKPSSRLEEYLNRVGVLMFTKYVKRIQRIILKTSGNAPIKALVGILGFSYLGGLPSIHEQSFAVKDWYGDSIGPGNVFPVYGPIEHLMNFVTPSLLKASTYDLGI